jgi:pimeloyl-ACP methyl ester carboxylesterase
VVLVVLMKGEGARSIGTRRCGLPILLIHGLGGSAESWIDSGYVEYLEGLGFPYRGVVRVEKGGGARLSGGRVSPEDGGVFVLEVSDSWARLDLWQREVRWAVLALTERTGMPRVSLVGFSAGGVTARKYLVGHLRDHRVGRLVTVSSPNGRSEVAVAAELQRKVGRLPLGRMAAALLTRWERNRGLRPSSPLLAELLPPESGNYLDVLNRSPHPEDVEYACVIATGTEVGGDWRRLQEAMARTREGKIAGSLRRACRPA